ncbi:hypothetical protein EC957_002415 [Mortierella hygrophila]|uniref:C2H2-type domain-containing protein n=1 Tax=Mortierella hygrophila TaxID=979708 RepID=A0A9P6FF36_9FUNG|nr:hypothetical protein EC957_002415 [Mortierella hygrophila]
MPSLPALMSPGSSMNEFSESIDGREEEEDDDEDLDEYEIFATPHRCTSANINNVNSSNADANIKQYQLECTERSTMGLESGFPFLPTQHLFHNHSHHALPNTSGPMNSEYQQPQMIYHHQQPQERAPIAEALHILPLPAQYQQQQRPMYASNFIQQQQQQPFIPISAPLHHAVPTISVEQVANSQAYVESGVLTYYISSLESQQQPSLLSTFESSLDLLMTPHLPNGSSISNASFALSPTMSWASVESSRPASPEQQQAFPSHTIVRQNNANNKRPRLTKKHSVPLYRKAKYVATERHASTTEDGLLASPSSVAVTGDDSTRFKRKRRVRQTKPKVKPTSFSCDVPDCGKVFSRAYNLTSHMKTHSAERPFLCDSCPLAFARRHDRERHVRLHTGEKPYNCRSCGSGFMRNDALHRHQRICGQSVTALVALLQQNGSGGQDGAAASSLEGLNASSLYQGMFEL